MATVAAEDLSSLINKQASFCLNESALGDLGTVAELLGGLRDAWHEGVLARPAAA